MADSEMRVALLKKAFISDWEGAAPGGGAFEPRSAQGPPCITSKP